MKLANLAHMACGRCPNTLPEGNAPRWLRATDQPLAGTRIAVCNPCYRSANAALRQPTPAKCVPVRAQEFQPAPRPDALVPTPSHGYPAAPSARPAVA